MNTNNSEVENIIDVDIKKINKKRKFNMKLSLTGILLTTLSAIPSLREPKFLLDETNYFMMASICGMAYTTYSNLYRKKHLKKNQLLISGPYNIHRNPEYVGDIVFGTSLGAMTVYAFHNSGNSITAALSLLTMSILLKGKDLTIDRDDLELEKKFGEKFREYKNSIPKYIPKISNLLS